MFNDDYVNYLQDSISEIEVIYDPKYDFSNAKLAEYQEKMFQEERKHTNLSERDLRKKIKDKYYAEKVYNIVLSDKFGFENHDRDNSETNAGKIEMMDLYKDETMYAVKIGNSSSKLSFVVEQSSSALKLYKNKKFPNMPAITSVAVWIVLRKRRHLPLTDNKPDLSKLNMFMLKNRLDSWKKEVRLQALKPIIYINYWD